MKKKAYHKTMGMIAMAALVMLCSCGSADDGDAGDAAAGIEAIPEEGMEAEKTGPEEKAGEAEGPEQVEGTGKTEGPEQAEDMENGEDGKAVAGGQETDPTEGALTEQAKGTEPGTEDGIIWDDIYGEGIKTVEGDVISIDDGSFVISQIHTGTMEDGSGIAVAVVGGSEGEDLITVSYNKDVKVTIRTSADGMTSTECPGTIEELQEDKTVILTGSWEGERFRADEIVIFILDKK